MWHGAVSEPVTLQEMAAGYATIVSPMNWARRCGESMGHDAQDWVLVAEMLTLGTKHPDPNTIIALQGFSTICPTVTPITWWILERTEHPSDIRLYSMLFHAFTEDSSAACDMELDIFAVDVLRSVTRQLVMKREQLMANSGHRPRCFDHGHEIR